MKIFIWIISGVLGIIVMLMGLVYFLPGYDMYIVRSDSMKPVFSSGDMVFIVPPESLLSGEIQPGSIVTYKLDENTITHRVFSINNDLLITKGDANKDPDPRPVEISQISGVYLLKVPSIGYLNVFIRTKIGWLLVIILPTMLLVSLIIKDIIKEALDLGKSAKSPARVNQPQNQYQKE